ncbi:MAG: substrate-binding domain-containing protein [Verrucomicrobia bacterium]|nr:substrate-binding domain-containing protein [Verrucomicrobiota bacterium]
MKKLAALLFAIAALFAALALLQRRDAAPPNGSARTTALTVYCAAGLKQPVEAIAAKYRAEFGVEVQLQYGPTGALISNLRVAKRGDLFIAADDGSVADARKFELVREVLPLVRQHPVIAVRAGNPKNIRTLADLLRDDVKLALTNPDAASISRVSKAALGDSWGKLAARATVMKPTVTEIAADLSLGSVDAAILWDATVPQFKGLAAVEVPELKDRVENASAAVLAACSQPAAALKFARYLAAPEKGSAVFQSHGFQLADGDKWAEKPELILSSGGVNRLAIEKLLKLFADREGVNVTTVFNGCGVLCATMKTMDSATSPRFPDAYYACDLCFVPPVAAQFPEAFLLTETEIGIVVRKGNPKNVKTLADLAQPGLKLGLCNAEQSTLGFMTRGMLKQTGLLESVRKNVVVEVPTADFLINQMRAGGLEAAIVYRVNAAPQAEHIEFFPIKHEGARAIQPFAVRERSPNRHLARRLLDLLKANRGEFEAAGFQWRGNEPALKSKDIKVPEYLLEK